MSYFTKHLKDAKTGYLKHFLYATGLNFYSLLIFITGTLHAFFPFWFEYTPYKIAKKIVDITENNFIHDKKD
jgi:hypothetical protein